MLDSCPRAGCTQTKRVVDMKSSTRFHRMLSTLVLTGSLLAGGMIAAPAHAATGVPVISQQASSAMAVGATSSVAPQSAGRISVSSGVGLCGSRTTQIHVMAFIFGFCAGNVFLTTPVGKSMMKSIVNGACKVPWIVKAATWGKLSRC